MMFTAADILHFDNWGAFATAIFCSHYLSPENAFVLYITGNESSEKGHRGTGKERIAEIESMRDGGFTWPQINEVLGLKAALSYYSHYKKKERRKTLEQGN